MGHHGAMPRAVNRSHAHLRGYFVAVLMRTGSRGTKTALKYINRQSMVIYVGRSRRKMEDLENFTALGDEHL